MNKLLKKTSTELLKEQVGYHKYLVEIFKKEIILLMDKYYSKKKKPTPKQLEELEKAKYLCGYYFNHIKEIVAELKRRRDLLLKNDKKYCELGK